MLKSLFNKHKNSILKHKWRTKREDIARFRGLDCFIYYIRIEIPLELYIGNKNSDINIYNRDKDNNIILYKLGLTSKSVEERIKTLNFTYGINVSILYKERLTGIVAICLEKWMHDKYINKRINFKLIESGNSEIYKEDILGLDRHL